MIVDVLIEDVEVDERRADVAVRAGRVVAVGARLDVQPARVVDGRGGALIPALHDHHIHLLAAAAARSSVDLVALGVTSEAGLRTAVSAASDDLPEETWLRVVGYHDSIAGELTATLLDSMVRNRPVRVQHRSGVVWVLNSRALAELAPMLDDAPPGVERDARGAPTGRCTRVDGWLRDVVPSKVPDVATIAGELRAVGVTGVTDATPSRDAAQLEALLPAAALLQVVACTAPMYSAEDVPVGLHLGPVKLLFDDHDVTDLDAIVHAIRNAHAHGRAVAVHAVTRAGLAIAVAVFDSAGARHGDRIEHGAVVPPDLRAAVRDLGLQVVTQPAFVACRGDDYLRDVDAEDLPWLWPCRSLLDDGIGMAAGSDAPYGPLDPWQAITAAVTRRTPSGRSLGPDEAVDARRALDLYLGYPHDPAGPRRVVAPGAPADLCLLHLPLSAALRAPNRDVVRETWSSVGSM